jgi:Xaa-Pro aminopeptidase
MKQFKNHIDTIIRSDQAWNSIEWKASDLARNLPDEIFLNRINELQEYLHDSGHAAALIDQSETLYYYTGYDLSEILYRCLLVPMNGTPVVLVRKADSGAYAENSVIEDCRGYRDWEDGMVALAEIVAEKVPSGERIAADFHSFVLTPRRLERLRGLVAPREIVDIGSYFSDRRIVKEPAEIELIAAAGVVADRALPVFARNLRVGENIREAIAEAGAECVRAGADTGRIGLVTAGEGYDFSHKPVPAGPLAAGTCIHVELTPRIGGYGARLMRPVMLGTPSAAQVDRAARLIDLQDRQIALMEPGRPAHEADRVMRDGAVAQGLRPAVDNTTGYSLGHYPAATPRTSDHHRILSPAAEWRFVPGMIFHVVGSAEGMAFSETVLVSESCPVRLNRSDRRIFTN